jgi:Glycosyltransferase family 87
VKIDRLADWNLESIRSKMRRHRVPVAMALASMSVGAIYTWLLGQDVNWDWQNYHEYNVWALLNGRYDFDAFPAGFQTYFNPAVYFPVYFLRHYLPQPYGMLILGAIHGLNLLMVYFLARTVLQGAATAGTVGASMLIAASGPMTLSEVGTSLSDILTALPVLAGFTLALRERHLLAGLLLGAAVGLKLTNIVYALGVAAAVLVAQRPLWPMISLALGGAIGGVATGGAWSLMLWHETGNPVFPLFNGIFRSRELWPVNILDRQFLPRNLWDALAYPIYWMLGDNRSSEYPFRDARFAAAMALFLLCIGKGLTKRTPIFTRGDIQLFLFAGLSYAAWLSLFSIQRYAIVLELTCGPLIILLLLRCFTMRTPLGERKCTITS